MSLLEEGFRYCSNPERTDTRWLHPVAKQALHPDWIDITDLSTDQLLAFFGCEPSQRAQQDDEQLGLF